MKYFIPCAAALLLFTVGASADYLELSRAATLKANPSSDAETKKNLAPPMRLTIIDSQQTNGYYHVKDEASGVDGWVYRTLGRRFRGNIPDNAPGVGVGRGNPRTTQPAPNEFAIPTSHAWGSPTKTDNCKSANGPPDVACTPGDILMNEREALVCSPDFHTGTVRGQTTSSTQKNQVYPMYGVAHPANNTGSNQMCEIDHLVSLELGGADDMANLWPECSPGYENWQGPGFRDKDGFENYLWFHVCVNKDISLMDAQIQIATNWRRYWELAGKPECRNRAKCE